MMGRRRGRAGFTLIELLVAMTVTGIVGAALIQVIMAQNRSAGSNEAWRVARSVSRGSLNRLLADLRLAESDGALDGTTASGTDITLRVPYAFGVACNDNNITGPGLTVSLLPVDPTLLGAAYFAGFAWRDVGTSLYRYRTNTGNGAVLHVPSSNPAICVQPGDTITTLPGGSVVNLTASTIGPGAPTRGMNVFLYQRVRYWFGASIALPGKLALWRSVVGSGINEELAAPFDTTARFRFYDLNSSVAQTALVSPLSDTRGVEIHLDGLSETTPQGSNGPKRIALTTSIWFKNRHD
jgi:prepilin-type N-terminal cleavage/methylation domain-containing protein